MMIEPGANSMHQPIRWPFAVYVADISVVDKKINIRSAVFSQIAGVTVLFTVLLRKLKH